MRILVLGIDMVIMMMLPMMTMLQPKQLFMMVVVRC